MAVLHRNIPEGRYFTAEELVGRQIRIEGPAPQRKELPTGRTIMLLADDECIGNAFKVEITLEANDITQAKIWLYRFDQVSAGEIGEFEDPPPVPTEVVTLRDNIELSFSAIASEVQ